MNLTSSRGSGRALAAAATFAMTATSAFLAPTLADATPAPAAVNHTAAVAASQSILAQDAELGSDDPSLQQSVAAGEQVAPEGQGVVFEDGHADMGPMLGEQGLTLLVRDDREATAVWRHPEDIVFQLGDAASQVLPEGSDYDFTGAKGGEKVWLVPQMQKAGVPWLGWNTQAPSIVESADRGVTLEFLGHQGPGQFSVFLQNGGFGQAQQLWNSGSGQKQSTWVDLNTHTHANWVFTEPGVHLVAMNVKVAKVDGTQVSDTAILRFAVGGADPAEAAAKQWEGDLLADDADSDAAESANSSSSVVLWVAGGLIAVAAVLVALGARNRRAGQRRKAAARAGSGQGDSQGDSQGNGEGGAQ
nr:choice-of-anchor M domain-containing protein [Corynebacterium lactis]